MATNELWCSLAVSLLTGEQRWILRCWTLLTFSKMPQNCGCLMALNQLQNLLMTSKCNIPISVQKNRFFNYWRQTWGQKVPQTPNKLQLRMAAVKAWHSLSREQTQGKCQGWGGVTTQMQEVWEAGANNKVIYYINQKRCMGRYDKERTKLTWQKNQVAKE